MADIVNAIPHELSNFGSEGGDSYSLSDIRYDYAIGGIPFLSATRDQWPYTEGMAEIRKQQFDSFAEPGEQSLYGWWLRSQSSFNAGAGVLYQDPDFDNQFNHRFADSLGVDPWTSGELGLLRETSVAQASLAGTVARVQGYVTTAGVDSAYLASGGSLWSVTASASSAVTWGTVGTVLDMSVAGNRGLVLATDGLWSTVEGAAATKMFTLTATPTAGAVAFAKGRIVTAYDNQLYFNPINTGATVAIDSTDTFTFTHTDPNWKWTSISEGPTAIYAAGKSFAQSAIYKFTVSLEGATETVITTQTAVMPTGETINSVYGYIGSFLGIATSKGFRVGEFDNNGDVVYGPLLFEPTGGCQGIVGFDRFMFTGSTNAHDSQSGVFRVDLGNTIQEQSTKAVRYAYARDAYAAGKAGSIQSVTMLGATDRLFFPVTADSAMLQSATVLVSSGYLKTGRIRFNTEEPKLYKFVSLRVPSPLQGDVSFALIDESGAEIPYITYGPLFSTNVGDVATATPAGRQNWIILKFTLARGSDTTQGGVLNGWQVKALPGSTRQRLISHTFLLFDEEKDKSGQRVGTDGYARERFESFKSLARAGDVVTFQDLYENVSTLVVIDDWKFTQLAPPGSGGSTIGGYLTVVMRTVAEGT